MDLKDLIAIKTLVDLADHDNENQRALNLDDEAILPFWDHKLSYCGIY